MYGRRGFYVSVRMQVSAVRIFEKGHFYISSLAMYWNIANISGYVIVG